MENKNTSKNNFYNKNLKYLLGKDFYLVNIITKSDDFGIGHDYYHFLYKGLADDDALLSLPLKGMFSVDIESNEKINNKIIGIIARKD